MAEAQPDWRGLSGVASKNQVGHWSGRHGQPYRAQPRVELLQGDSQVTLVGDWPD